MEEHGIAHCGRQEQHRGPGAGSYTASASRWRTDPYPGFDTWANHGAYAEPFNGSQRANEPHVGNCELVDR